MSKANGELDVFNHHVIQFKTMAKKVIKLGATQLATAFLSSRNFGPKCGHKSKTTNF